MQTPPGVACLALNLSCLLHSLAKDENATPLYPIPSALLRKNTRVAPLRILSTEFNSQLLLSSPFCVFQVFFSCPELLVSRKVQAPFFAPYVLPLFLRRVFSFSSSSHPRSFNRFTFVS